MWACVWSANKSEMNVEFIMKRNFISSILFSVLTKDTKDLKWTFCNFFLHCYIRGHLISPFYRDRHLCVPVPPHSTEKQYRAWKAQTTEADLPVFCLTLALQLTWGELGKVNLSFPEFSSHKNRSYFIGFFPKSKWHYSWKSFRINITSKH